MNDSFKFQKSPAFTNYIILTLLFKYINTEIHPNDDVQAPVNLTSYTGQSGVKILIGYMILVSLG